MDLTDISGVFDSLLKASPTVGLALGINFILMFVGKIPQLQKNKDWLLPLIAMFIGGFCYPFVVRTGDVDYSVRQPTVYLFIIGLCVGGLSVAIHTIFKAKMKKWFGVPTGDTMIITKEDAN